MTSPSQDRLYGANSSLAYKAPCRVATTANITLSGEQTIDGVAVVTGDRVLVKDQTTASANGIYIADTSTWQRAPDFDGNRDIVTGTTVIVTAGSTNANTYWRVSTTGAITVGTTSLAFAYAVASDSALVDFLQAGTGAASRSVRSKLRETVSVTDFGAVGDGTTNDWQSCQEACDYVQSLGGGTVLFPPGYTFRIAGNTIILWGENVKLVGYGATIYKDNAGGSAGTYGDAISIFGKLNGNLYNSPQVAGTYSVAAAYSGSTIPSRNIVIEGFKVTFGTHSSDTINGISGENFENVTVRNCVVEDAPQTGFAWVSTGNASCKALLMEDCLVDGSGMQAYRFNVYNPNAGSMTAKVIGCRSLDTALTVASPWSEQYGLPSSAFVRASSSDLAFQVTFEDCDFDATVHLLDGYRSTSLRDCRMASVFALNASAECQLLLDNCKITAFKTPSIGGGVASQVYIRNTSGAKAVFEMRCCTFEAPGSGQYSIYSRGFDLDVSDSIGALSVYSIDWNTEAPRTRLKNVELRNPGSATITLSGDAINLSDCKVRSPISIINGTKKMIVAEACRFVVDSTFSTYCIEVTNGNVSGVNNIIEYTDNAYATILFAPVVNTVLKANQYLYAGGTELSYDQRYATTTPASGYWQVTSRIINSAPSAGNPKAWVCTVAGATGTWVSEGNL